MGGQHLVTWEQKTRDACQRRRCEKDCRPTIGCLGAQHRDRYDDAGHNTDKADHDVKERECGRRHSQDHDAPPSGLRMNTTRETVASLRGKTMAYSYI